MRAWILLIVIALAGCSDPGREPSPEPQEPTPETPGPAEGEEQPARVPMLLDFDYNDCQGIVLDGTATTEQIQPTLPEGFTASDPSSVRIMWWSCATFTTPSAQVNDTVLGWVLTGVEFEGETGQYLHQMFVQTDIMETLWDTAGYPLRLGTYTQEEIVAPPLPAVQRSVSFDGFDASGEVWQSIQQVPGDGTLWHQTEAGLLEWTMGEIDFGAASTALNQQSSHDAPFDFTTLRVVYVDGATVSGNNLWLER